MADQRGGGIAWTDESWNPVRGCSRVSEGCRHCYAERVAVRFSGPGQPYEGLASRATGKWTGKGRLVPEHLGDPLKWKRPRRVFVNSMSDLFHESLSFEEILDVYFVMSRARHHVFQVLTKRPARRLEFQRWLTANQNAAGAPGIAEALQNVWEGVSVEDQATADERIPLLLRTPAAVRFVSYEPALGPVDLGLGAVTCDCCPKRASRWIRLPQQVCSDVPFLSRAAAAPGVYRASSNPHGALCVPTADGDLGVKPAEFERLPGLDWVIVGGESGPGARPFDVAWARSVASQCRAAGVAFFFKQAGRRPSEDGVALSLRDPKGGDLAELPQDLRIREFPSC